MKLTKSQERAFDLLKKIMRIKLSGIADDLKSIRPRMPLLLIGPSGCGKSAVVKKVCRELGYPLFITTCASWIPEGAKSEPPTLKLIRQFVQKNARGIIFLDEVNKLRNSMLNNPWSMTCFNEILALLDADLRLCSIFEKKDIIALEKNFLCIGAGAWQDEFESSRRHPTAGFGGTSGGDIDTEVFEASFRKQSSIPTELFARFSATPCFIYPPDEKEIREMILAVHKELEVLSPRKLSKIVQMALDSPSPVRWMESYVLNLMLQFDINELAYRESEKSRSKELPADEEAPADQDAIPF